MEFWFSGEDDNDVSEAARVACNEVCDVLNGRVRHQPYGDVVEWAVLTVIMTPRSLAVTGYDEIRRYWRKKKETEFRLKIDHAAFKAADDLGKRKLIFALVLRSIDEGRKLNIPDFDFERFEQDVRAIGKAHGWL